MRLRWPDGKPQCPYCGAKKSQSVTGVVKKWAGVERQCKRCWRSYTAVTGTIASKTKTPIEKWAAAVKILMLNPNVSGGALAKAIGAPDSTARRMKVKILAAIALGANDGILGSLKMPDGDNMRRLPPSLRPKGRLRKDGTPVARQ